MEAGRNYEIRKLYCSGGQGYVSSNFSSHSDTVSYYKPTSPMGTSDCAKRVAACEPERGRAKRIKVLETARGSELPSVIEGDFDLKSNAESTFCCGLGKIAESDDETCIDDLYYHEGARKKLQILAGMVGSDSAEPEILLSKVVAVMKDMDRRSKFL